MVWSAQINGTLYDGSFTLTGEGTFNVAAEMSSLIVFPPSPGRGYLNFVFGASFLMDTDDVPGDYDPRTFCVTGRYGHYEIRYGSYTMSRFPLDMRRVASPKVTGLTDGTTVNVPGDTYVVGNGTNVVGINIGSDRPFRGDAIYYQIRPGVTCTLKIAVNCQLVDNTANTNKYIINP